ncbi:hypothetical protein HK100_011433 [Physocladia obscura]|uniref:Uncharacterized protein n=1 Tax=Physocladia obscura TaxID=109957 RepID=A0AAD5XGL8_9FUNG|nr:hypothetical protein HK100_011433 [Physocladia obscura]
MSLTATTALGKTASAAKTAAKVTTTTVDDDTDARQTGGGRGTTLWWFGGASSALACVFTHPLDTLKVRMQTQAQTAARRGVWQTAAAAGGLRGLYKGVDAAVLRQLTYSSTRFGVYEAARRRWCRDGESPVARVLAASLGGVAGAVVGTPADLANVRMQADASRYRHAAAALAAIVRGEGVAALWTGVAPNVVRAVPMTAGQIATYDSVKLALVQRGAADALPVHLAASLAGALVATTLCAPVDVVKSRVMAATPDTHTGAIQCAVSIAKNEGPAAFFKGWTPAFVRLGPQTVLTFVFLERIRSFYAAAQSQE